MLLKHAFVEDTSFLMSFQQLLHPQGFVGLEGSPAHRADWISRRTKIAALLAVAIESAQIIASRGGAAEVPIKSATEVFLVHGHDFEMRETVARFLTGVGLEPVLLDERANSGRTLIEKFEANASVGYAVVLLSPDDVIDIRSKGGSSRASRARQNAIFELGYFVGALGRDRVATVYRKASDFEMPSDLSGVAYVPFDDEGGWRIGLSRDLVAAGYKIDFNSVIRAR